MRGRPDEPPPMGFECPWQQRCPHLDGRSIHDARLRLDNLPRTVDELRRDLQETNKTLEEALRQIQDLRKEVAHYKSQWQALHRKQFKTSLPSSGSSSEKVASTGSEPIPLKKKKRGAPRGHPGWHRCKPSTVDQWVEVPAPSQCPDCGCRSLQRVEKCCEHLQEDIVLQIRPVVTGYRHHQAHCPHCNTDVIQEAEGELFGSPIGPVTKATATYLRYALGLPYRKIQSLFETLFGMRFVPATAWGFDQRASLKAETLYEDLRQKIQASQVVHADETHWRVDGINHFLWYAGNRDLSFYLIDPHRSAAVAQSILGDRFHGTLISDSYGVYLSLDVRARQACLAHYLRDCKDIEEKLEVQCQQGLPDDPKSRNWIRKVGDIFKQACAWSHDRRHPATYRRRWTRQIQKLCRRPFNFQPAETFRKRLIKEKNCWLTFMSSPKIDPTNNHAERALRPSVIFRKICFGNRSLNGANTFSILTSILHTARKQSIHPIDFFQTLILSDTPTAQAALYQNSS